MKCYMGFIESSPIFSLSIWRTWVRLKKTMEEKVKPLNHYDVTIEDRRSTDELIYLDIKRETHFLVITHESQTPKNHYDVTIENRLYMTIWISKNHNISEKFFYLAKKIVLFSFSKVCLFLLPYWMVRNNHGMVKKCCIKKQRMNSLLKSKPLNSNQRLRFIHLFWSVNTQLLIQTTD